MSANLDKQKPFLKGFVVDEMLGKLAKWLRLLGFDTIYIKSVDDSYLVNQAFRAQKILLTRDTKLIERKHIPKYILIRSDDYMEQLKEIIEGNNIRPDPNLFFSRCLLCNTELRVVSKEMVKLRVPDYVYETQAEFFVCPKCDKVYWNGTHIENVKRKLKGVL